MIRRLPPSSPLSLSCSLAAPVIAGGWAEIVADAQTTEPPARASPSSRLPRPPARRDAGAVGDTTVHFTNSATGETIDVVATNDGADGHFIATDDLPRPATGAGRSRLQDLASEHIPVPFAVSHRRRATLPASTRPRPPRPSTGPRRT